MKGWRSTTDFVSRILKEEAYMQRKLESVNYITRTKKTICITREEFRWMYKKVYD